MTTQSASLRHFQQWSRWLRSTSRRTTHGLFVITQNGFTLIGLAVIFGAITLAFHPEIRHSGERALGNWLQSRQATVTLEDIHPEFKPASVAEQHRAHIDSVLEVYAGFTGTQLEEMTHQEGPWIAARRGYGDAQRCEIEIDEQLMRQHYTEKFQASQPSGGQ